MLYLFTKAQIRAEYAGASNERDCLSHHKIILKNHVPCVDSALRQIFSRRAKVFTGFESSVPPRIFPKALALDSAYAKDNGIKHTASTRKACIRTHTRDFGDV